MRSKQGHTANETYLFSFTPQPLNEISLYKVESLYCNRFQGDGNGARKEAKE